MAKRSLPPGFRFHPTDVELVKYYLKRKVMGQRLHFDAISELNIYNYCPWDLPGIDHALPSACACECGRVGCFSLFSFGKCLFSLP